MFGVQETAGFPQTGSARVCCEHYSSSHHTHVPRPILKTHTHISRFHQHLDSVHARSKQSTRCSWIVLFLSLELQSNREKTYDDKLLDDGLHMRLQPYKRLSAMQLVQACPTSPMVPLCSYSELFSFLTPSELPLF